MIESFVEAKRHINDCSDLEALQSLNKAVVVRINELRLQESLSQRKNFKVDDLVIVQGGRSKRILRGKIIKMNVTKAIVLVEDQGAFRESIKYGVPFSMLVRAEDEVKKTL